jgi:hypothetical protein
LSHLDKTKLYDYTFSARTKRYWHRKHSLNPELIKAINWDACAEAMSKLPFWKTAVAAETCNRFLQRG